MKTLKIMMIGIMATLFSAAALAVSSTAISSDHWAIDYADFTLNMGFIEGGAGARSGFNENTGFKRCEVVYALAKVEGVSPSNNVNTGFSDVAYGSKYAGVIAWGASKGIVSGNTDGTFDPDGIVNKEQFCAFLYRYCNKMGVSLPLTNSAPNFADASEYLILCGAGSDSDVPCGYRSRVQRQYHPAKGVGDQGRGGEHADQSARRQEQQRVWNNGVYKEGGAWNAGNRRGSLCLPAEQWVRSNAAVSAGADQRAGHRQNRRNLFNRGYGYQCIVKWIWGGDIAEQGETIAPVCVYRGTESTAERTE